MTTIDNDLKTILKIRKMRVDALVRVQRQHEQAKTQAADTIDRRQQELIDKEVEVREIEVQRLRELTNGQYVKIDRVEAFSKLQLKGIKQIVDANQEIEIAHKYFEESKEVLKDSVQATQAAQKKLISIEEAVRELSGK